MGLDLLHIMSFMNKLLELIGTVSGIIGALLVASKMGAYGYPLFLCSSLCLLVAAVGQRQRNFIALQGVYFATNLIGFYNYALV